MAQPVTRIKIIQRFYDTQDDLIYNIILKLGGTMADVKQYFNDTTDDLLYALLTLLDGEIEIGGGGEIAMPEFVGTLSFTSPLDQIIDVGITPGGNEIYEGLVVNAEKWTDLSLNVTNDPETTWYITGNNDLTLKIRR
jgi:hypothetical protein